MAAEDPFLYGNLKTLQRTLVHNEKYLQSLIMSGKRSGKKIC
jgi:hypothetical protein